MDWLGRFFRLHNATPEHAPIYTAPEERGETSCDLCKYMPDFLPSVPNQPEFGSVGVCLSPESLKSDPPIFVMAYVGWKSAAYMVGYSYFRLQLEIEGNYDRISLDRCPGFVPRNQEENRVPCP